MREAVGMMKVRPYKIFVLLLVKAGAVAFYSLNSPCQGNFRQKKASRHSGEFYKTHTSPTNTSFFFEIVLVYEN